MKTSLLKAFGLAAACCLPTVASAATKTIPLTVKSPDGARTNAVVKLPLLVEKEFADAPTVKVTDAAGRSVAGQLTEFSLTAKPFHVLGGTAPRELVFIWPELPADGELKLVATLDTAPLQGPAFAWKTSADGHEIDLNFADTPVLRYMCAPLDDSSPEAREKTYKPYHHVFNPAGTTLLSKGPGSKFPHHRGLYYGFSKVTYGDNKNVDTWHCKGDTHESHQEVLSSEAGPVLGRHRVRIGWHGQKKELFADEIRELTAYRTPGGTLIEFASKLISKAGPVKVDGDPQHAGFHFRAAAEVVDSTAKQTYYLRPDGPGKQGETRNWPGHKDHANLPWNAMSFVVGGNRYTAEYIDRPENPKEARFSERDYGRFGSYFVATATPEEPLVVNYRFWVQAGEMNVPQAAALADDFVKPAVAKQEAK